MRISRENIILKKNKLFNINSRYIEIYLSAMFLLIFIFFNVLISSTLFIFKKSVSSITPILSIIISLIVSIILLIKHEKLNLIGLLISVVFPLIIIITSIYISGKIIDYSYDGNSYQKATIGLLAMGWNPLYENVENFEESLEKSGKQRINIADESPLYINHYAKGANIYAANIYKLTKNIECGKSQNFISICMVFLFTFSFLLYKNRSILFDILFSLCASTYSIVLTQTFTNYIDIFTYVFLYLTIFSFFVFEEKEIKIYNSVKYFMYFMILVLAINTKMSLFGYVGLYCFGYLLWYIYRLFKKNIDKDFFKNFLLTSILSVVIGIFIVGLSVYPKNYIEKGHPFYPLMGKDKIDIMTVNQPSYFKEKSSLEKFLIATFSKVANIIESSNEKATWKIPFTIYEDEFFSLSAADTRISGNGIWFGGILILSIIIILLNIESFRKRSDKLFYICLIPTFITIVMIFTFNESWYARYFPQLYFIALLAIIILETRKKKIAKIFNYFFIIIILINNFMTGFFAIKNAYNKNIEYRNQFAYFDSLNIKDGTRVYIYTNGFNGAKFNIIDRYSNRYILIFKSHADTSKEIENEFFNGGIKWGCDLLTSILN